MTEKDYYTILEASELVNICPSTMREMCRKGYIDGLTRVGNTYAIPHSWIKMHQIPEGFLSAPKAAKLAGISRWGMQKAVDSGKVDSIIRTYARGKPFILVNVKNSKWHSWVAEAQARSARYK